MSTYTTITLLETRYAVDFNTGTGVPNFPFSPTDAQITAMVTAASEMINRYAGKSFSDQASTPSHIEEACNMTLMRMIEERWLKLQLMGATSVSDEYGAMSVFAGAYEILTPEIRLLIDEEKDVAIVINTN